MVLIRQFEDRVYRQYSMPIYRHGHLTPAIGGFMHLCSGQEAIAVGAAEVFRRGVDTFVGTFRSHGWVIALGTSLRAVAAELHGRDTGCSRGRGGSVHLFDAAAGNLGTYHVAAGQLPLGAGAAFAAAYRNTGGVAFVVVGEGAINQGTFAETLNLASLLRLPAVFILEDNGVALGTKVERHSAETDLVRRGSTFAMPARGFDGNDVETVVREVGEAADRARAGGGPTFLVARTFRFRGFSMSDPLKYRTDEEQHAARARDPIRVYAQALRDRGLIDDPALQRLQAEVETEVDDAMEFAEASPDPAPEERFQNTLADRYPFHP